MKVVKLLVVFVLLISLLPIVSATITIDAFSSAKYNVGDKIYLNGQVSREIATRGYLSFNLLCDNNSSAKIAAVLIDVDKDKPQQFSQLVLVPRTVSGKCDLDASLSDEKTGEVLETAKLNAFEVTNELSGTFDMSISKIQLGDTLSIKGSVGKTDSSLVSGTATITFKKDNNVLFADSTIINNGVLDYERDMSFVPPGNYNIEIEVMDNLGNSKLFNDFPIIELSSNIQVIANFDKALYGPGENIVLNGYVSGTNNLALKNVEMIFDLNGEKVTKVLKDNIFSVAYATLTNIKSGNHEIQVYAKSDGGNYGARVFNFTVDQVPTKLGIRVSGSFNPGEEIPFSLILLDQAGDEIRSDVNVGLTDSKNKLLASGIFGSNTDSVIKVPDGTKSGVYKIKAEKFGLSNEGTINVKEFTKLETTLEGNVLKVKNIGNVKYSGPLTVVAGDVQKSKNIGVSVGDTKNINLDDLLPAGVFDVNVPISGKTFDNVKIDKPEGMFSGLTGITGYVPANVNTPGRKSILSALLIIIFGCAIYLVFRNRKGNNYGNLRNMNKEKQFVSVQKPAKPTEFGKATQEDIEDFRKRMQAKFQEEEKQESKDAFLRRQERAINEDRPKGGIFNMFN